ncbi:hypothetical protein J5226_15965 [Lysobacter sp. K5869]|uniref:hypothetical protein n=1 Tax=Lysobacter sp. K5869 TaxID=2820808 RepID=UPI001C0607AC|nr:hypothetical protein [Lysobacter sp. K5869]QWP75123.1 hypothetical protein J5226_15965 [Lysobacter sp. K5869]
MKQARIAALALAVALAACSKPPAAAPEAAQPAPAAQPAAAAGATPAPAAEPAAARPALPEGACAKTEDGFDSFLEAYIGQPDKRAAYTAPDIEVRELKDPAKLVAKQSAQQAGPFRIALVDSQWSYFDPAKPDGEMARIDLNRNLDGDRVRVDYVKAEFSPDEEVVKTLGAPEAYVFEFKQGCWQLTQQLR